MASLDHPDKFNILLRQLNDNVSLSIGSKDIAPSGVIYETIIPGLESNNYAVFGTSNRLS